MKTIFFGILCIMFLCCTKIEAAPVPTTADEVPWGYSKSNGPSTWAKLSPDYVKCGYGKVQSPINITTAYPQENSLQIEYKSAPLTILNDGLTTLTVDQQTLAMNLGRSIQINFSNDAQENIKYDNEQYKLVQFHFHTPAEHRLKGKKFAAEIHLVNQGKDKLAVIGVFIKEGKENADIQHILDNIPKKHESAHTIPNLSIDPSQLLPENKSYYTYEGSLSTPPCVENVQWIVMKNPIEASATQIKKLHAAIGEDNARPVQELYGRKVYYVKM